MPNAPLAEPCANFVLLRERTGVRKAKPTTAHKKDPYSTRDKLGGERLLSLCATGFRPGRRKFHRTSQGEWSRAQAPLSTLQRVPISPVRQVNSKTKRALSSGVMCRFAPQSDRTAERQWSYGMADASGVKPSRSMARVLGLVIFRNFARARSSSIEGSRNHLQLAASLTSKLKHEV